MVHIIGIGAAVGCSLAGLICAWQVWKRQDRRWLLALAALLWVGSTAIWIALFGVEIGIPLALETAALIAFAFILSRIERREAGRPPRERIVSAPGRARFGRLRGAGRVLIAGPLGMAAAMGVALVVATQLPTAEQTRLILAGLIVPSLWCGGIAWVACDRRLLPQAIAFAAVGGAGFGVALLTGA